MHLQAVTSRRQGHQSPCCLPATLQTGVTSSCTRRMAYQQPGPHARQPCTIKCRELSGSGEDRDADCDPRREADVTEEHALVQLQVGHIDFDIRGNRVAGAGAPNLPPNQVQVSAALHTRAGVCPKQLQRKLTSSASGLTPWRMLPKSPGEHRTLTGMCTSTRRSGGQCMSVTFSTTSVTALRWTCRGCAVGAQRQGKAWLCSSKEHGAAGACQHGVVCEHAVLPINP